MALYDFNDAEAQREFDVIPHGTVVPVVMTIRPGATGDGGWATASVTSDATYLNAEFTVSEGPYINRKFWQNLTISGGKVNEKGESIAWNITKSTIRAMLNSARGVKPDDDSEAARKARVITSWGDLNGLQFIVKVKVEKDKKGQYPDKNQIAQVIEPGHKDYTPDAFSRAPAQATAAPAAPKPAWAQGNAAPAQAAAAAAPQGNLPAWAR